MTLQVSRVPPEAVDAVWARLAPLFERALSHGAGDSTTSEHVLAALKGGDMVLWCVHRGEEVLAGLVLSVQKFPAKTTVFVELLGGRDMNLWMGQVEGLLRDYGALVGADSIEAMCRPGLVRKLKGWRRKATLLELSQ